MKKYIITGFAAAAMLLTGCDKYLDINNDPQSPSNDNMTPELVFPAAEMAFANSYGDYLRITGGYFAQYYGQNFGTSNYQDYSKFVQSSARSSSTYANLCNRTLQNLSFVRAEAKEKEEWGTYLAATVLHCATYQIFVDCYGSVPYSEALDVNNLTPHYDEGKDVYAGILKELDEALSKVAGLEPVCTNFLLPGQNASEWVKVANALKLRLLMRESGAVDVKADLAALVAENNFPTQDVCWQGCWQNMKGQANPFYQEEFADYFGSTQKNVVLNLALLKVMDAADDPRLEAWFSPNANDGAYKGMISGTNMQATKQYKDGYWCRPVMTYDAPVYFISVFETEFFLAEYEATYGNAGAAEAHYNAAVQASVASAGASDASDILAAYPWNAADWKKNLGIQKWVALAGTNPFEGWCELRRIGYPAMGSVMGSQLYDVVNDVYNPAPLPAGELYTPIDYDTSLGAGKVIQRWPYPESSMNRNKNTPAFEGEAVPVFWAK